MQFSNANSINIGRLVLQVVYYVHAYLEFLKEERIAGGESINVRVPTGNPGNILAAYFTERMGLSTDKLICASNDNRMLFDFFETGIYDESREFILATSPPMGIPASSNLEHLLYLSVGYDATETREFAEALKASGRYTVTEEMRKTTCGFAGSHATQERVAARIRPSYEKTDHVIDTHTAATSEIYEDYRKKSGDKAPTVIANTASPLRFSRTVMETIMGNISKFDDFAILELSHDKAGVPLPPAVEEIRRAEVRHNRSCKPTEMESMARSILFE